jgi:hypothetical protein
MEENGSPVETVCEDGEIKCGEGCLFVTNKERKAQA